MARPPPDAPSASFRPGVDPDSQMPLIKTIVLCVALLEAEAD